MDLTKLQGQVPQQVLNELPLVFNRFKIDTPERLSHFLGQCAHESGNFQHIVENLNYGSEGLLATFPKYFPNKSIADQYSRNPQMIANKVYANRMGNGPETSGMGWKYKGRGYIQLTGYSNYNQFDTIVDDDITNNSDLVATKYPLLSAAWFWNTNKITILTDKGIGLDVITAVTKKVNGGTIGLDDRIKLTTKFYNLLKI